MAIVIEAPNEFYSIKNETENLKIFIAGGITNCPDWQQDFIQELDDYPYVTLLNPRRKEFDIHNPYETEKQIIWEHRHLEEADLIIFYFSKGSVNPIALFELGKYLEKSRIVIGIEPGYERERDVTIQSKLAGYTGEFYSSVKDLANKIKLIITEEEI